MYYLQSSILSSQSAADKTYAVSIQYPSPQKDQCNQNSR